MQEHQATCRCSRCASERQMLEHAAGTEPAPAFADLPAAAWHPFRGQCELIAQPALPPGITIMVVDRRTACGGIFLEADPGARRWAVNAQPHTLRILRSERWIADDDLAAMIVGQAHRDKAAGKANPLV